MVILYCLITYLLTLFTLLTHSLTPWSRVLLEKLTISQLVKKFPAFYGTGRFITAFTSALYCTHTALLIMKMEKFCKEEISFKKLTSTASICISYTFCQMVI